MGRLLTTEEFIKRSKRKHGDKFDYSLTEFFGFEVKIKVICPIHGLIEQRPYDHLRSSGCRRCGYEKSVKSNTEIDQKVFEERCNKIHDNFYNYNETNYINLKTKVKIICPLHGKFEQNPVKHLSGQGCKKCSKEKKSIMLRMSKEEFINRSNELYNNKYDYSLVKFENQHSKIKIICPDHGIFEQFVQSHLTNRKCKKCAKEEMLFNKNFYNFSKDRWLQLTKKGFLYLVKCSTDNEVFYKVGITGKTIEQRYKSEKLYKVEIIDFIEESENLERIWDNEVLFHSTNKKFKYIPKLEFNGKSECYEYCDEILNNFKSLK